MKSICTILLFSSLLGISSHSYSQNKSNLRRIYFGLEFGGGNMNRSYNGSPESPVIRNCGGFYLGYALFSWLKFGLIGSGWSIEPGNMNDPSKGIGIGNAYAQCKIFPLKKVLLFINLEAGRTEYSNNHELSMYTTGPGAKFGIGFEHRFSKHVSMHILSNYAVGRFEDVNYPPQRISVKNNHYNVFELLMGFSFYNLPLIKEEEMMDR